MGTGVSQAPSLPSCLCYPWKWGCFRDILNVEVSILLGKGVCQESSPKGQGLGCDWSAPLCHLSHMSQVQSGDHLLLLFPFKDSSTADLGRMRTHIRAVEARSRPSAQLVFLGWEGSYSQALLCLPDPMTPLMGLRAW